MASLILINTWAYGAFKDGFLTSLKNNWKARIVVTMARLIYFIK